MPSAPSRRRLLRALAGAAAVGLAGCSGDGGDDADGTSSVRTSGSATMSATDRSPDATGSPSTVPTTAPGTTERSSSGATTTASASYSPPEYVDRSAFVERSRTVDGPACPLPAALTLPRGGGSVPGVVIVPGSGPQDRDGTVGPNKPYRDLAWGLASRGVATLRYPKRTHECPGELPRYGYTIDDVVTDDAVAALATLADEPRIGSVSVVGHSLGGAVAPRIATRFGDVAGVGLLAANARPLYELLPEQYRYLAELDGTVSDAERRRIAAAKRLVDRIEGRRLESGRRYGAGNVSAAASFWRSLREYDRVGTADALSVPYFVAQGKRDYRVSVAGDFRAWKRGLADHEGSRFELYPRLNHLFFRIDGRSRPAVYVAPNHVDRSVVEALAAWIDAGA